MDSEIKAMLDYDNSDTRIEEITHASKEQSDSNLFYKIFYCADDYHDNHRTIKRDIIISISSEYEKYIDAVGRIHFADYGGEYYYTLTFTKIIPVKVNISSDEISQSRRFGQDSNKDCQLYEVFAKNGACAGYVIGRQDTILKLYETNKNIPGFGSIPVEQNVIKLFDHSAHEEILASLKRIYDIAERRKQEYPICRYSKKYIEPLHKNCEFCMTENTTNLFVVQRQLMKLIYALSIS
jgi:hypothetical protein